MIITDFKLQIRDWLEAEQTQTVMRILNTKTSMGSDYNQQAMFVGGCVRNSLLGAKVDDVDIATCHTPEKTMSLLKENGVKVIPTGIKHGTVTAILGGQSFEITTLRVDVKTDGRHADVAFTQDWKEDASRRDFTMNALYLSADGKTIYDFFSGISDLNHHRVRFIGEPQKRIEEDFLRILRFFRFSSIYGQGVFDEEGVSACQKNKEGIETLSKERIRTEFFKILKAPHALKALHVMYDKGILDTFLNDPFVGDDFETFIELENNYCSNIYPLFRLYVLSRQGMGPEDFFVKLRLSKEQKKKLFIFETFMEDALATPENLFYCLYYYGAQKTIRGLFLKNIQNTEFFNNLKDLKNKIDLWNKTEFPVLAQDLIEKGMSHNKILGDTLKSLEKEWALSHGKMSKHDLLNRVNVYS